MNAPPPGGTLSYGLNGDVRPDGVSISSLFVLNRVSLHLHGKGIKRSQTG